ncbi:MAG TPA: hypothetical protein PKA64_13465 [Myxococcota bacterium]|nr:hypothetical protein [Myxococcota bacterium]
MIPLLLLGCQPVDPALLPDGELPPPMSLDGSPMVPGQPLRLEVEGAAPQAALTVLMGRLGVACPPQASGCLDISPPYTTVGNARADAAGRATLSVPVPPGMPRGRQMHFQAVSDPRRLSKSNVLTRVVGQSCRFGDLLAEEQIGGFLADQDRIYDDGTWLYVSTNTTLHQLDFDLVPTGRQSPLGVYGNHGFAYDRRGDRLLAFSTASAPGQVWEYNHDGSALVAGPVPTGSNTGGGAVDRGGVLHVVERVSPGLVGVSRALGVLGTWGTAVSSGQDAQISNDGSTLYHFSWSVLSRFDLDDPARPLLGSVSLNTPRAGGFYYDEVLDEAGNLYAVDRQQPGLEVYDPNTGIQLASIPLAAGSDPASVHYVPGEHAVYVGYYRGGNATVQKLCAY